MNPKPILGEVRVLRADAARGRETLRHALSAWSGLPPEELPLRETPRGPVWQGLLHGAGVDLSLSYCGGQVWMAWRLGGAVGIDVTRIEEIPETALIARDFFGSQLLDLARSPEAFARGWTELEARLKCLKRSLGDLTLAQARAQARGPIHTTLLAGGFVLTVAMGEAPVANPPLTTPIFAVTICDEQHEY